MHSLLKATVRRSGLKLKSMHTPCKHHQQHSWQGFKLAIVFWWYCCWLCRTVKVFIRIVWWSVPDHSTTYCIARKVSGSDRCVYLSFTWPYNIYMNMKKKLKLVAYKTIPAKTIKKWRIAASCCFKCTGEWGGCPLHETVANGRHPLGP